MWIPAHPTHSNPETNASWSSFPSFQSTRNDHCDLCGSLGGYPWPQIPPNKSLYVSLPSFGLPLITLNGYYCCYPYNTSRLRSCGQSRDSITGIFRQFPRLPLFWLILGSEESKQRANVNSWTTYSLTVNNPLKSIGQLFNQNLNTEPDSGQPPTVVRLTGAKARPLIGGESGLGKLGKLGKCLLRRVPSLTSILSAQKAEKACSCMQKEVAKQWKDQSHGILILVGCKLVNNWISKESESDDGSQSQATAYLALPAGTETKNTKQKGQQAKRRQQTSSPSVMRDPVTAVLRHVLHSHSAVSRILATKARY